ncbi:MAG: hypothetical protein GC189_11160 [Alphaproteobacteria bacterium]|nr:hypothetical protein [Alphaproteobacteria bacterium]
MKKLLMASVALAGMSALAGPAFAQARTESATSDAPAATNTRARLAPGETASGSVGEAGDADWFRVSLAADQTYRISLSSAATDTPLGDPFLRVLTARGEEVVTDDDSGGNLNSYVEFVAPARGTYYIEAKAFGDGATGDYTLTLTQGETPGDISTDLTLDAQNGAFRQSTLTPAGDTDWYRMQLGESESVRLSLTSNGEDGSALGDPYLTVRDSSGAEIVSDDDGGEGLNSYIEFTAPTAGTYFVEARGFSEEATGAYALNLTPGEIGGDPGSGEYMQPNGEPRTSRIQPEGDKDSFSIDMIEGRAYRFNLIGVGEDGALSDPYLSLVDAEGGQIAADDDGGTGLNAYLSFVAPSSGTYYAVVSAFADGGTGAYELRVSDSEVPGNAGTDEFLSLQDGEDGRISRIDMPGDKDWFRVDLTGGQIYTFAVNGYGPNPLSDSVVTVLGDDGSELATDDDSGEGENALLGFTPQQTGTFVVQVTGYSQLTGEYDLTVRQGPPPAPEPEPRPAGRRR